MSITAKYRKFLMSMNQSTEIQFPIMEMDEDTHLAANCSPILIHGPLVRPEIPKEKHRK